MSEIVVHSKSSAQTRSPAIQAKLTISQPGDAHEREADRVADEVMRMPANEVVDKSAVPSTASPAKVQRLCTECDEEQKHKAIPQVQRKEQAADTRPLISRVAANIQSLRGGGSELPASTRAFFEPRFGADFSDVRVHTGTRAEEAAKSISARAFTLGNDIALASGEYSPDSAKGRTLLAHELTHVVQQQGSRSQVMSKRGGRKSARVDLKTAQTVLWRIMEIMNSVRPFDVSELDAVAPEYKPLLVLWVRLTDIRKASRLSGQAYIDAFETARAQTEPLVTLVYSKGGAVWKGGPTWQDILFRKWSIKYYDFEKRADSERNILHLRETETSYSFDPEPVDMSEFLRVASANRTRPMVLQRGAGIQVGVAVAGKVYHPSQKQPRLVLWASPAGLFYEENGGLFKQSQAGFSNDIILGIIIKAAEDVGPFVSLVTAIVDIAISLTPVGWVYDLTNAARAVAKGDWKSAAMELLPGPAINGIGKVAKATRVGRAAIATGAKGFNLVGKAFSGVKTFVAKGIGKLGGKRARGMWLVTDGGKTYHFADEADGVWREVNKVDADEFIKCNTCRLTPEGVTDVPTSAGKGDVPTSAGGKAEPPSSTTATAEAAESVPVSAPISKALVIDKKKFGALKQLAGRVHGLRRLKGQAIAIVEVKVNGKIRYLAASNASAPLTAAQKSLLKEQGIQVVGRAKGIKETIHAEHNIEYWVKRMRKRNKVEVSRWGMSAGERGAYVCSGCRAIVDNLGGVIEEFGATLGKTYL